jgi:hypothetical protein
MQARDAPWTPQTYRSPVRQPRRRLRSRIHSEESPTHRAPTPADLALPVGIRPTAGRRQSNHDIGGLTRRVPSFFSCSRRPLRGRSASSPSSRPSSAGTRQAGCTGGPQRRRDALAGRAGSGMAGDRAGVQRAGGPVVVIPSPDRWLSRRAGAASLAYSAGGFARSCGPGSA